MEMRGVSLRGLVARRGGVGGHGHDWAGYAGGISVRGGRAGPFSNNRLESAASGYAASPSSARGRAVRRFSPKGRAA